jgi:hypothetical protein
VIAQCLMGRRRLGVRPGRAASATRACHYVEMAGDSLPRTE